MFPLIAFIQDDGLTFREVLANIPDDVAAIFVYLLLAAFIAFIWWGGRSRSSQSNNEKDADEQRRGP